MAELQVLHGEPRHKVMDQTREMLGRREETIKAMRPALSALLAAICDQLTKAKEDEPRLPLEHVRFAQTRWTPTGKLVIEFEIVKETAEETDRYYVDDLVDEMVGRNRFISAMRAEIAQFISAMVDQFSYIKKHNIQLDLSRITFTGAEWIANALVLDVRNDGKPYGSKEARL